MKKLLSEGTISFSPHTLHFVTLNFSIIFSYLFDIANIANITIFANVL